MRDTTVGRESGDAELIRLLHEQHGAALWAVALRTTADRGRAQDAVQETLLRAWRHPDALDPTRGDPRPWLLRTLRNVLIDEWRARTARPELLSDDPAGVGSPTAGDRTVTDHAEAAVQAWTVGAALDRLSVEHRTVLVECYYRGRTVGEAAAVLNIPAGTVKSRVHYALRALRLALEEMGVGSSSCPHRFDVGVYVLGALDPGEREAFEAHLVDCSSCPGELAAVAGLPGLLSRADAPARGLTPEPPPEILAGTLRRVSRRRRVALLAAASAVVLALATGAGVAAWTTSATAAAPDTVAAGPDTVAPGPAREIALPAVAGSESSGLAGLTARPWGTQVALTCLYQGAPHPPPAPDAPRTTYVLVVRGSDGRLEQIASWSPPPGQDVKVAASTDLPTDRVSGLEVRTTSGAVVMRS